MTETAKSIASLRRQLAEAQENLLLIQERKAEFVMGTSVPLDLIKEERRTERQIEELEQRLRELEQLTPTPSPSHTTSIGSVTGPVHTGSGDIHIEHYGTSQATGKYQVDAPDAQVGVIGDGVHIEGGIHFHAAPSPVPSPSQPEDSLDEEVPSQKVSLQVWNGQFVCAVGGGGDEVLANRDEMDEWATFDLIELGGNKIALRASNRDFISAKGGGGDRLYANRRIRSRFETFKLRELGNDKVALRSHLGPYVRAEGGGGREVTATGEVCREWETFRLIRHDRE